MLETYRSYDIGTKSQYFWYYIFDITNSDAIKHQQIPISILTFKHSGSSIYQIEASLYERTSNDTQYIIIGKLHIYRSIWNTNVLKNIQTQLPICWSLYTPNHRKVSTFINLSSQLFSNLLSPSTNAQTTKLGLNFANVDNFLGQFFHCYPDFYFLSFSISLPVFYMQHDWI